jgi:hypothetical protein
VAVHIVESANGSAASAEDVTVSFPSAETGDLLLFTCSAYFKEFGESAWLPNSGWLAIPGTTNAVDGVTGALFHIVAEGETSWTPCNDDSNSVAGVWLCYRVQGHSIANPILNFYQAAGTSIYDLTCPGAAAVAVLGMAFAVALFNDTTVGMSGGVSGGGSWTVDSLAGSGSTFHAVAHVQFIDNVTPATGVWASNPNNSVEFVIQCEPGGSDDGTILSEEVCPSYFYSGSGIGFDLSAAPGVGNRLVAVFLGSDFLGISGSLTPGTGWVVRMYEPGILVATRLVSSLDATHYEVSSTGRGSGVNWGCFVYEIGSNNDWIGGEYGSTLTGPPWETPSFTPPTSPAFIIYAVTSYTDEAPTWPDYTCDSGQVPDGGYAESINAGGIDDRFCCASGHMIVGAGATTATFELPGASGTAHGATLAFGGSVPCPPDPPATTIGALFPVGIPQARVTVYQALTDDEGALQVVEWDGGNSLEVGADFVGGSIQYEDTPSGCGAATLSLGIPWEVMEQGPAGTPYWLARNIVEISAWDDVIQSDYTAEDTKIYIGSRYGYDAALGQDKPQLILDDGTNVTYRIKVTGVGTDGGGDYVTVETTPGTYPGSPSLIPSYAAGTAIYRRRYTGIIMKRGLYNSRTPQGQVKATGLAQYLSEAVGTFTINLDEVGDAIYNCLAQFASRWPQLTIDSSNFPYTGNSYSGSNQQYTLADEITQILSCGVTNGDTWVVRVGHDRVVRLLQLYSQACTAYNYDLTLRQGTGTGDNAAFEALSVTGQDEDVSNFYNSVEVTGDTNPTTKQAYGAIVQDDESIELFGQVDGVPISNTSCKSDDACAAYAQALLNDNAIPRNNYQVNVYTYNNVLPSYAPMGLSRGDVILGVHNIIIKDFLGGAPDINGLAQSVQTTMDGKTGDTMQVAQFAQIEPNWNLAVKERANRFAITLRRNVVPPVSVDSYMVGAFADQIHYSSTSLGVTVGGTDGFQAAFSYGGGIVTIPQTVLTMNPSTTNYVFLDSSGTFHIQGGNPIPTDDTWMLHSIYQTSASGVVGHIFKAPQGVLGNNGSGGPGSGSVTEVDTGTGLTGGPITSSGEISLAPVDDQRILANISGASAAPVPSSLSAILDDVIASTRGSIITRGASGWANLVPGTLDDVLTSGGSGADISWQPGGGSSTPIVPSGSSFPGSPTSGQLYYRTDLLALFWYSGSAWKNADSIASLNDVALTSPANGDVLTYDSGSSTWKNAAPSGGGVSSLDSITGAITLVAGTGIAINDNTPSSGDIEIVATSGFQSYDSVILGESSLVAYYKMGETSGTTLTDSKGTNNGTYAGTFQLAVPLGIPDGSKGVYFDGLSGVAHAGSGVTISGAFTFEFIFRFVGFGSSGYPVLAASGSDGGLHTGVRLTSNNSLNAGNWYLNYGTGSGSGSTGTGTPTLNVWDPIHIAITYDGTTLKMYMMGVLFISTNVTVAASSIVTAAAYYTGSGYSNYLQGIVGKMALYSSALSAADVASHADLI